MKASTLAQSQGTQNNININEVKDITFVDYFREGKGIIKLDLEEDLPIYDNKYDFIICFNVFEHIYNGRNLAKECLRILRPNGHFFGFVPFLVYYHADPNDYIRYTHQGLERLFADAGFDNVEITSVGYGAFQAAVAQFASLLRFRLLKFVVYAVAMGLDNLHRRFSSRTTAWTLSYHIKAHKKAAGPA